MWSKIAGRKEEFEKKNEKDVWSKIDARRFNSSSHFHLPTPIKYQKPCPLQFKENDKEKENKVIQFDRRAQREVEDLMYKNNISEFNQNSSQFESKLSEDQILKLAAEMEEKLMEMSSEMKRSFLSHLPFHLVERLIREIFHRHTDEFFSLLSSIESSSSSLKSIEKEVDFKWKGFELLIEVLISSENWIHQSQLRERRSFKNQLQNPNLPIDSTKAFRLYSAYEEDGTANSLFKKRGLTKEERNHPFLDRLGELNVKGIGSTSINVDFSRFKRALNAFSMGMFKSIDLSNNNAVLTGGAVLASLLPWSKKANDAFDKEKKWLYHLIWILSKHMGLPKDILGLILNYCEESGSFRLELDEILFNYFHKGSLGSRIDEERGKMR
eukprot:TRINITY_DN6985_c0_g1_i2.p1 TRINITY_DN6985_c0_g1~~TRINITY_DN6985_c0_g1_i2.p1  ORF type:complete len:383 (-),score=169.71 TRINITY_DN6985_c0_g1_i2:94-1242(-)